MTVTKPIKIAVFAMGGEGGGVLADWLVDLAEGNGWFAQTTSIPGVAQRTGATVYYVEMFPGADSKSARVPVFAQSAMPGDVDIVLASELMEAGRAVLRGYVTPDRTTLITSTSRVYSVREKSHMGDGRVNLERLYEGIKRAPKAFIRFDMSEVTAQCHTVISAILFGALSGAQVLPFGREQFEETIRRAGRGVEDSLAGFGVAYSRAQAAPVSDLEVLYPKRETRRALPHASSSEPAINKLLQRVSRLPEDSQWFAVEGVRKAVDYQDPNYAALYLDRLEQLDAAPGGHDAVLLGETARYLALWMAYEDTYRVADLKTRASRFERVRTEVHATDRQVMHISEYMHPRVEEICDTLPKFAGAWLARPNWAHRLLARFTRDGRVMKTSTIHGFLLMYVLALMGRWRRFSFRYKVETVRIESWLRRVRALAAVDPALAVEAVKCQRLVKGYSDTHARGLKNFETLMAVIDSHTAELSPKILAELRDAALTDEFGNKLKACLAAHNLLGNI